MAAGIATNLADLERGNFVGERLQSESAWEMIESAFNGAIFLLLGLQMPSIIAITLTADRMDLWQLGVYVTVLSLGLLALRWLWFIIGLQGRHLRMHMTASSGGAPPRLRRRVRWLISAISALSGIRGAVTLAGALSIPLMARHHHHFPERDLLIFLAAGTILFTLIVGSIGLPPLLRLLPRDAELPQEHEERLTRLVACRAAIASMALSREERDSADPQWIAQYQEAVGQLTQDYRRRIALLDEDSGPAAGAPSTETPSPDAGRQRYIVAQELRLKCLRIEREAIYAERQMDHINDEALRHLVTELDLSEVSMRRRLAVALRTQRKKHAQSVSASASANPPNQPSESAHDA